MLELRAAVFLTPSLVLFFNEITDKIRVQFLNDVWIEVVLLRPETALLQHGTHSLWSSDSLFTGFECGGSLDVLSTKSDHTDHGSIETIDLSSDVFQPTAFSRRFLVLDVCRFHLDHPTVTVIRLVYQYG
jgi:hypothetical protein